MIDPNDIRVRTSCGRRDVMIAAITAKERMPFGLLVAYAMIAFALGSVPLAALFNWVTVHYHIHW